MSELKVNSSVFFVLQKLNHLFYEMFINYFPEAKKLYSQLKCACFFSFPMFLPFVTSL